MDAATGDVAIVRYVVQHDCGTMVNPTVVEGQIQGGVAQGIGGALYERLVFDESGQPLCTSYADFLMPTAMEVPSIEIVHLETPSPLNPLGIKGVGEAGAIPGPAVLAEAIEDALAAVRGAHPRDAAQPVAHRGADRGRGRSAQSPFAALIEFRRELPAGHGIFVVGRVAGAELDTARSAGEHALRVDQACRSVDLVSRPSSVPRHGSPGPVSAAASSRAAWRGAATDCGHSEYPRRANGVGRS